MHSWGSRVSNVTIEALDENGRPLIGAGAPTIAVATSDHSRLTVTPVRNTYGTFALRATLVPGAAPCNACRVVRPGKAQLDVSVTAKTGGVKHFSVPVDVLAQDRRDIAQSAAQSKPRRCRRSAAILR